MGAGEYFVCLFVCLFFLCLGHQAIKFVVVEFWNTIVRVGIGTSKVCSDQSSGQIE